MKGCDFFSLVIVDVSDDSSRKLALELESCSLEIDLRLGAVDLTSSGDCSLDQRRSVVKLVASQLESSFSLENLSKLKSHTETTNWKTREHAIHKPVTMKKLHDCLKKVFISREVTSSQDSNRSLFSSEPDRQIRKLRVKKVDTKRSFKQEERDTPAERPEAKKILIVEDNLINQKVAKNLLLKMGFNVQVANNGQEGVEKYESYHPDLILMDCQMPVMDGYTSTQNIRGVEAAADRGEHIPIVALTAHAMSEDKEKCLAAGMDEYLTKPLIKFELVKVFTSFGLLQNGTEQLESMPKKKKKKQQRRNLE
eukprot:TRINITY_DN861_c0_g3_i1.p1 TRINITY_DN861_c0_g3~~TRINITY_DN861_c0_g3_i1.p1  ORF type:complete len:324 (-),score=104.81 TRINITY_DN861_c0_g3_i1:53-982(-)